MIVVVVIIVLILALGAGGWFGGFIPSTKPYYKKGFANKDTTSYSCGLYNGSGNAPVDLLGSENLGDYQDAVDFWKTTCSATAGTGGDLTPPAPPSEFDTFFDRWEGKDTALVKEQAQAAFDAKAKQAQVGTITQEQMDEAAAILEMAKANVAEENAAAAVAAANTEEEKAAAEAAATAAAAEKEKAAADAAAAQLKAQQDRELALANQSAVLTKYQNDVRSLSSPLFASNSYFMKAGDKQKLTKQTDLTPQQCLDECSNNPQCTNVQFLKNENECQQITNDLNPQTGAPYTAKWHLDNPSSQKMGISFQTSDTSNFLSGLRRVSANTNTIHPNQNNQRCGKFIMDTVVSGSDPAIEIIKNHGPMDKNLSTFCRYKSDVGVVDGWENHGGSAKMAWNPVCKNAYANGCYIPCEATIYGGKDFGTSGDGKWKRQHLSTVATDGAQLRGNAYDIPVAGQKNGWNDRINSIILGPGCDRMELAWHDYRSKNKKWGAADFNVIFPDSHGLANYYKKGARLDNEDSVRDGTNRLSGKWRSFNKNLSAFVPDLDYMNWEGPNNCKKSANVSKYIRGTGIRQLGPAKACGMSNGITGINVIERKILP
jgi:hypothetical protein